MERFKDKIVVITGAGSGIGRSTALRLDSEGATCIIVDINESQLEVQIEDWNKILNINLTGTFFMCSHALPMLLESKGAIVNVSSTAALGAHAWTAAYSASKGGISAFSKTLAVEYGMKGLNINCVCPASIETPMSTNPIMPKDIDTRLLKKIMPLDGVNRSPDDIASTIAFLASDDAIHINGIDLRVDGGLLT